MSIKLIIDSREQELIKHVSDKLTTCTIETLDIGDIVFKDESDETLLVIERKTVQDLKASIVDGRGREQKARLISNVPKSRIIYLVEGKLDLPLDYKIQNMPVSTLVGSMINTMLRDNIKVYKTSSIEESANFLVRMYEKLSTDKDKYFNEEDHAITAAEYSSTLKKKKKANMTPDVWFISQLSMIPQVTEKIAEEIIKKYPTPILLVQEYQKFSADYREKMLADIIYPLKTGKTRRIGDKVSKRIYQMIYGINETLDNIDELCEDFSSNNIK